MMKRPAQFAGGTLPDRGSSDGVCAAAYSAGSSGLQEANLSVLEVRPASRGSTLGFETRVCVFLQEVIVFLMASR